MIILLAQIDSERVSTNLAQIRAETPRHGHNKHQTSMAKGLLQPWRLQKMPPQGIWFRRRILRVEGFVRTNLPQLWNVGSLWIDFRSICDFRSELGCSSNLLISSREMKMITLSFIKIQNPPVSLSSASPLGFIAQAWWMWLPQEHLTPQAIQRFKHATQLQLVTFSILTFGSKRIGFHKSCFSPFLSPAPSSLSISGATLARDNSMQQRYPNSSSGANPTRQCKVVEQF